MLSFFIICEFYLFPNMLSHIKRFIKLMNFSFINNTSTLNSNIQKDKERIMNQKNSKRQKGLKSPQTMQFGIGEGGYLLSVQYGIRSVFIMCLLESFSLPLAGSECSSWDNIINDHCKKNLMFSWSKLSFLLDRIKEHCFFRLCF